MQEKPGVAARLLYQLYFSLERKRTTQMSGTIMEISQSAAVVGLHKKEQEMYSNVRMTLLQDCVDVALFAFCAHKQNILNDLAIIFVI